MREQPEIIKIPNPLKGKAGHGSKRVDPAAVERAEQAAAGLQADYVGWAMDDLRSLQAAYDKAAAAPVEDRPEAAQALFAAAHEMKGQGGSFGYPLITEVGSRLCQLLERSPCLDDATLEVVRLHIDGMEAVLARQLKGDGGDEGFAMLRRLQALSS